jgi:hypothetical protein
MTKSSKILSSKEEIKAYIGNISDYMFRKYIKKGLPARFEDGSGWWAHTDNVDEWFRVYTRVSMKNAPDEMLE